MAIVVIISLCMIVLLLMGIYGVIEKRKMMKHREEGTIYFTLIDNPEYLQAFKNALDGTK